jgi:hypothetical protein
MTTAIKTLSSYDQQAIDLLNALGVKFTAKFLRHGKHFEDDREKRDIFTLTLSRNGKRISFKFGQSIMNSTGTGSNAPTPYDLLASVQKYDPDTFENFCSDFGYNDQPLSPKVRKIYTAVVKEWEKVNDFFTSEELEQIQEIN